MSYSEKVKILFEGVGNFSDVIKKLQAFQSVANGIKMKTGFTDNVNKGVSELIKKAEKAQALLEKGFSSPKDAKAYRDLVDEISIGFSKMAKNFTGLKNLQLKNFIDPSTIPELVEVEKKIAEVKAQIQAIGTTGKSGKSKGGVLTYIKELQTISKSGGLDKIRIAFETGDIQAAQRELVKLKNNHKAYKDQANEDKWLKIYALLEKALNRDGVAAEKLGKELTDLTTERGQIEASYLNPLTTQLGEAQRGAETAAQAILKFGDESALSADKIAQTASEVDHLKQQMAYFFSIANGIQLFKRAVREAYETVKELDAAMTETAVVTEFSVSDLWKELPRYTKLADELGATTLGAYQTMTLYYQQGMVEI